MICKRCGAINDNQNIRCNNCHNSLQESSKTVQYSQKVFQSPLKQARPSNIITANAPSYSQQDKSEGQTMNHQTTQNQSTQKTYKAAADPEHRYQTQTQNETQAKVSGGVKRKTILLTLFAFTALFAAATALYLYLSPRGTDANFLFAEAEKKFSNQNYATALIMYRQFVEKFPEDHLGSLAKERIEMINNHFAFEKEMKEQKIEELLEKAKEAFRRHRYLRPKQDNVVFYTSQVLELVPTNSSAIELQALVIRYYESKAQDAAKRGYSKTAINYYQNILKILPNDSAILAKIDSLQSPKKIK
jgi:tetratricopeptide (TPR) repeat protein